MGVYFLTLEYSIYQIFASYIAWNPQKSSWWVGGWWCFRPILVLCLSQAEQLVGFCLLAIANFATFVTPIYGQISKKARRSKTRICNLFKRFSFESV